MKCGIIIFLFLSCLGLGAEVPKLSCKPSPANNSDEARASFIWNEPVPFDWIRVTKTLAHQPKSLLKLRDLEGDMDSDRLFRVDSQFINRVQRHMLGENGTFSHFNDNFEGNLQNRTKRRLFFDSFFGMQTDNDEGKVASMTNVWTNSFGLIVNSESCQFVRNGGCIHMYHSKDYSLSMNPSPSHIRGSATPVGISEPQRQAAAPPSYEEAVLTLCSGAFGTWHFPMESAVALAYVEPEMLARVKVMVPSMSSYILEWLSLFGVNRSQIVHHSVLFARTLLVPEMGRCGAPFASQLLWMREHILRKVFSMTSGGTRALTSRTSILADTRSKAGTIVLVQRTKSRRISNHIELERAVRLFAEKLSYEVVIHTDRNLPSLADQIKRC